MSRCKHCNKLIHSEHLDVYYDIEDVEKVVELYQMENWTPKYMYSRGDERLENPDEFGKLLVGDIIIHFICKTKNEK